MHTLLRWSFCLALSATAAAEAQVIVNDKRLDTRTVRQIEKSEGAPLAAGRYWYDPRSGLWGRSGGPARGQWSAGLPLGTPPGGKAGPTQVIVNGRPLHPQEQAQLQKLVGPLAPGYYWMNDDGVGGPEGQPAQFDLQAAAQKRAVNERIAENNRRPGAKKAAPCRPAEGALVLVSSC